MAHPPVGDDMLRANWVAKSNCRFYNFVIADWGWNPIFEGRLASCYVVTTAGNGLHD